MKNINRIIIGLTIALCASPGLASDQKASETTVGIVTPVSVPAMTEIVNGFKQRLNALHHGPIKYIVQNAQGDINMQRSILQQYKSENVNLVVPIGTAAAQMANAINTTQPIVALAAEFKNKDRQQYRNKNITNILDEVSIKKQINFIHTAFPSLKKITLIYSPDDHIFPQVKQADVATKNNGIVLQKLMIQDLPDLYTVSHKIDSDSQAIFILKDELIVSGIDTLIKQARQRKILLIASDDGSVQRGANFAVGVSEHDIGAGGADLANTALKNNSAGNIPIKIMTHYHVYVNTDYYKNQNIPSAFTFEQVKLAAKKIGYDIKKLT